MKNNSLGIVETGSSPQGQCPLCRSKNPYTTSACLECSFPLPWAKTQLTQREPFGLCTKCRGENPYTEQQCWTCGAFLPWAYALSEATPHPGQLAGLPAVATPVIQGVVVRPQHRPSDNSLVALDGSNRFVDAISFLCPALGFVAYISLLARLPMQAGSAARYAFFGLCLWVPVLVIALARSL